MIRRFSRVTPTDASCRSYTKDGECKDNIATEYRVVERYTEPEPKPGRGPKISCRHAG